MGMFCVQNLERVLFGGTDFKHDLTGLDVPQFISNIAFWNLGAAVMGMDLCAQPFYFGCDLLVFCFNGLEIETQFLTVLPSIGDDDGVKHDRNAEAA